jgi:hypothetical protein
MRGQQKSVIGNTLGTGRDTTASSGSQPFHTELASSVASSEPSRSRQRHWPHEARDCLGLRRGFQIQRFVRFDHVVLAFEMLACGLFLLVSLQPTVCFRCTHAPRFSNVISRPRAIVSMAAERGTSAADEKRPAPKLPTPAELTKFYVPCLALWMSGPLLSLVDTSAIGLSAAAGQGATQLAALGPATTFCDGSSYLFAFLNVATTNLYASARAAELAGGGAAGGVAPSAVVQRAAKVASVCGLAALAIVCIFGRTLLALYVGHAAAANAALLGPATAYVTIRALSLPAALVGGVLQAALLGAQDSAAALVATSVATGVNVVGDLLLVTWLKLGLSGAAWATAAAQWAATLVLVRTANRQLLGSTGLQLLPSMRRVARSAPSTAASTSPVAEAAAEEAAVPKAALLGNRAFLKFAAPVLVLVLGKMAAFGFMTHAAASLGAVPLAAHQIALTLYFFFLPLFEVLSQTAQVRTADGR